MSLPDFLIAGDRRCGTTSLYHWIKCHPDIYMPETWETTYFIDEEVRRTRWVDVRVNEEQWFRTHSVKEYSREFEDGEGCAIIGGKCPDLLFWKPTHSRLERYLPECSFIVILRNPVERAWSHYWHEVGKGREWLSFEDALAEEESRAKRSDYGKFQFSYMARGCYDQTLTEFFRTIDASRVKVMIFEKVMDSPVNALREIYDFVGVEQDDDMELAGTKHHSNFAMVRRGWANLPVISQVESIYNKALSWLTIRIAMRQKNVFKALDKRRRFHKFAELIFRKRAEEIEMKDRTRKMLTGYFVPHIEALEKMLGLEIKEWK